MTILLLKRWLWGSLLALGTLSSAQAAVISFDVSALGGNQYRYDYTVTNNGTTPIDEFTVFFDLGLFDTLSVSASPAGWDSLVAQPDPLLPDDGFFDSLAAVSLAPGDTATGFSVLFNWLGQGTPGAQAFTIVDALTLETLESGRTSVANVSVPEPGTLLLLALGLLGMTAIRKRTASH